MTRPTSYPSVASMFALCLLLAGVTGVRAQILKGPEIRAAFTNSTVAGRYLNGTTFSEFHAADGRVLGDNGFAVNIDACWNIDGDAVCYHYGPAKSRRTYCFTVEKTPLDLHLRTQATGKLNAIATITKGNPRQHNDGGRRWSCDDLLAWRAPEWGKHARNAALPLQK